MSRRPPELPEDLERLGHHLEAAVAVALRRHSRRQAVVSFVGAVVIAVPFAVAGAATSLAPGVGTVPRPPEPAVLAVAPEPPANGFILRRVATAGCLHGHRSLASTSRAAASRPIRPSRGCWLGRY